MAKIPEKITCILSIQEMGCHNSKLKLKKEFATLQDNVLNINVSTVPAFSNEIGGMISLACNKPITCEWKKQNFAALLSLSQDRMQAINVEPGTYHIHCSTTNGENQIVTATVEKIDICVVDGYNVTNATNDMSRDGKIEASISNTNSNMLYLWTSGITTDEPILHDVRPGTYCVSIISKDRIPIAFYHGCNPAVVDVSRNEYCLIHPM